MHNNSIINQLFYKNDKIVGLIKYKKVRTMIFSEKAFTIFIIEINIDEKECFNINLQNFINNNTLIGNIVILSPEIEGLEDLFPYKIIKDIYYLREDQFLKPAKIYENNLFDRSLDIYNNFCRMNKINIWTYRTKKENKKIFKELMKNDYEICRSAFSYIVFKNEHIHEFAYEKFKDFMTLVSKFPKKTKIYSYINLDKRHFVKLGKGYVTGFSNKKIELFL